MLGGFHFNDRHYADDDLTVQVHRPLSIFRIILEILLAEHDAGTTLPLAYMVDQSHNLKPKIEAMIQTVDMVQSTMAKAALVMWRRCDMRGIAGTSSTPNGASSTRSPPTFDRCSGRGGGADSRPIPCAPIFRLRGGGRSDPNRAKARSRRVVCLNRRTADSSRWIPARPRDGSGASSRRGGSGSTDCIDSTMHPWREIGAPLLGSRS